MRLLAVQTIRYPLCKIRCNVFELMLQREEKKLEKFANLIPKKKATKIQAGPLAFPERFPNIRERTFLEPSTESRENSTSQQENLSSEQSERKREKRK